MGWRGRGREAPLQTVLADFASHREANLAALDLDAAALAAAGPHHALGEVTASELQRQRRACGAPTRR